MYFHCQFAPGGFNEEYETQASRRRRPYLWRKGDLPIFLLLCSILTFDYDVGEDEDDDVDKEGICQVEWQTDSRVGSRKNIQHRAGGGDVKVILMILIMIIID